MAALTYYNNIPQPSQRIKDSQPEILTNFASLQTYLETNHVAFSEDSSGKHKFVSMPEQGAAPSTAVNEMAMYTKDVSAVSQLFVRRESNGTELNLTGAVSLTTEGWTSLPCGLILKWGYVNGSGPRDALQPTYTYPVGASIPVFSVVFTVVIGSTQRVSGLVVANAYQESRLYGYTTTQIQVFTSGLAGSGGDATDWTYLAIGQ